tara:strand:- start:458 stop:913 length:456 start_codon:yes stop_codon:yes gene_type:complete
VGLIAWLVMQSHGFDQIFWHFSLLHHHFAYLVVRDQTVSERSLRFVERTLLVFHGLGDALEPVPEEKALYGLAAVVEQSRDSVVVERDPILPVDELAVVYAVGDDGAGQRMTPELAQVEAVGIRLHHRVDQGDLLGDSTDFSRPQPGDGVF